MMNIRNHGAKESLGVKIKDGIPYAPNWVESSVSTVTDISAILLSQYSFENECPETKFQTIIS